MTLRVVHVIPTLTTGGAERQLESIAARSRHDVATICLYSAGPVGDAMVAAGQRVEVLGMHGWRKAAAVPRLAARLRRYRPDVVHVHLLSAQLWGIPAARLAGVPVIVSAEHSLMETTIEGRPHTPQLRALYRALERMTTRTVAVSTTTRDRLVDWGVAPRRIEVVDNGIDFDALVFDPAARAQVRDELGVGSAQTVIGAIGRLDPVKRMDQVIRGVAVRLRHSDAVLVIAGDGPLRGELQALAASLGVAERVRLLGARGDVTRLLSAMDVLVSASRDETFGMAVVEAVGSGLPVAYAQCPALDELATVPAGAVRLDPADPSVAAEVDAIERALDTLASQGWQRRAVPEDLVVRYGISTTAAALDALYERLGSAPS